MYVELFYIHVNIKELQAVYGWGWQVWSIHELQNYAPLKDTTCLRSWQRINAFILYNWVRLEEGSKEWCKVTFEMSWFSRLSDSLEVEPSAQMPSQMLLSQPFSSVTAVFLEENTLCVHMHGVRQGRQGGNVMTVNYIPYCARQLRRTVMLSGSCMPSGDEWRRQWWKQKRHTSSEASHQPEEPVSSWTTSGKQEGSEKAWYLYK